jgi:hypothetical protein
MSYFEVSIIVDGRPNKTLVVDQKTKCELLKNKLNMNVELIYKGLVIDDNQTLEELGITSDTILYGFASKIDRISESNMDILSIFQTFLTDSLQTTNILPQNNNRDYSNELEILRGLGFDNSDQNRTLLQLYNGNVDIVANILLGL